MSPCKLSLAIIAICLLISSPAFGFTPVAGFSVRRLGLKSGHELGLGRQRASLESPHPLSSTLSSALKAAYVQPDVSTTIYGDSATSRVYNFGETASASAAKSSFTSSFVSTQSSQAFSEIPTSILTSDALVRPKPTAEEIAAKKRNFNIILWGGGFVAPFLATFYYFGLKFWER
ncbi:hypothetical protein TrVE_jg5455 [Triparma verrucosa]|uniref:Uncharacterized protein n=2 Tax=Triparma TaxID=722752 RepID=A0A9W6ZY31_9STRA|nr:hypothetical protein TrST_g11491 [Triparma strigata]GMH83874.1 hypothetical protein TrVE_jg5455 [Triparma verrucosa]